MMTKIHVVVVLLFLTTTQIFCQNIDLKLVKTLPESMPPGSNQTIVFKLSNANDFPVSIHPKLQAYKNWKLFYNDQLTLAANSTSILPVGVKIPISTLPGYYQIVLEINQPELFLRNKTSVKTQILKHIDVEIKLINVPTFAIAGKDITASFSVYNNSNSKTKLRLHSFSGKIVGDENLILEIGESQIVNVLFTSDPDIPISIKQLIDLSITSGSYKNSAKSRVTIIPVKSNKTDKYFRLPIEMSVMPLYRNRNNVVYRGYQGEIYSNGSLDPGNKHFLEFRARGPNQFDNTVLGLYDEYFIKYNSSKMEIHVGDRNFSLSPLTEYGRYGTGIFAQYNSNKFNVGSFYMQPRFFPEYVDEKAGYFNYFFKENTWGLSYLQKIAVGSGMSTNLYSTNLTINPWPQFDMDMEYSLGKIGDDLGHGYRVEFSNHSKKTTMSGQYINAGKNYPGYYNNTSYLNGNFQYLLMDKLTLIANFHQDESNAQRDTLFGIAPYSQHLTAGFTVSLRKSDYLNMYVGNRERKDRMPLKKFHYEEQFARMSIVNNIQNLQTNFSGDIASTTNYLTNTEGKSYRSSLSLRYKPNSHIILGTFAHYYDTYRYSEDRLKEIIYGVESSINLGQKTQFSISYQNSYNIEDYYRDRNLFDLRFTKRIGQHHEFDFIWSEALKQKQIENLDRSIALRYTFKFGMPLRKTKHLGSLRGRLINKGVNSVNKIIINLGGRILMSDEDGLFKFTDIPPGSHYLYIDNSSMNFNEIPNAIIPMVIEIHPDKMTDIQIELTKAAAITGNVLLHFQDVQSELKIDDVDIESKNVIIELQLDDEIHREMVKLNEGFNFTGLRSGNWKLIVHRNTLGNNYIINNSEMMLNLIAGEIKTLDIYITKKARQIKFQQQEIMVR